MPMLNPFTSDAFSFVSLTQAINILPNQYGVLNASGLFVPKPSLSRDVVIEEQDGTLNLLPTKPVGSPGTTAKKGSRRLRPFRIPHIPHEDTVLPSEYANIREFGSENMTKTLAGVIADHLQTARNKFAITWEFLKWGALKGKILDADGSVIYNLFSEFAVEQKRVDFALGTSGTDVRAKTYEVARHIEDNLKGEVSNGIHCYCSSEFFDALTAHDNVEKYYLNYVAAQGLQGDIRRRFPFGAMVFEEHRGNVDNADGTNYRFIDEDRGIAFPVGTQNVFRWNMAPGEFLETVNTPGMEIYTKSKIRDYEKGIDFWHESNVLPMCARPILLVDVFTSN